MLRGKTMKFTLSTIATLLFAVSMSTTSAMAAENPNVLPQNSCQAAIGPLGAPRAIADTYDGKTLEFAGDIRSLRNKAKDGRIIVINGGDYTGQKFGNDNFSNICFVGTKLTNTRWTKTKASGIGFINADLTGATFDRVVMDFALFRNTTLTNVDASGAQLAYGRLDGGWEPSMANLKLDGARMVGFVFSCGATSVDGCSFDRKQLSLRGADLTGASVSTFAMWDARLDQAVLNNTVLSIDQITQFSLANLKGNVIIRASKRQVALRPDSFQAAAAALATNKTNDSACNNPDTPLTQLLCQVGQTALRKFSEDIERLNETKLSLQAAQKAAGQAPDTSGDIQVVAQNKAHERYTKALRRCALKDEEDDATNCVLGQMLKRRAVLIEQLIKSHPLEADGRALYVNADSQLIQAVARDPRLAGLTPLVADEATSMLLAYRDDDQNMSARGFAPGPEGQRCVASFAQAAPKSKRAKIKATAFTAWVSGAEFTMGSPATTKKKKRVKKPKKGKKLAAVEAPLPTGCATLINSGPMVRLPVKEDDFDRLWGATKIAKL